jgi:hypothetical protein
MPKIMLMECWKSLCLTSGLENLWNYEKAEKLVQSLTTQIEQENAMKNKRN